jgi:hypothetical protein
MQIHADPGQTLPSQKMGFRHENILYEAKEANMLPIKHNYVGTKSILRGQKTVLFVIY